MSKQVKIIVLLMFLPFLLNIFFSGLGVLLDNHYIKNQLTQVAWLTIFTVPAGILILIVMLVTSQLSKANKRTNDK